MTEQPWLSKDLLVRLRWWAFKFCGKGEQENLASDAMSESVSRIEKLEGTLRKIKDLHHQLGPEDEQTIEIRDDMTYCIVCDALEETL